jgi:hypothetical protein
MQCQGLANSKTAQSSVAELIVVSEYESLLAEKSQKNFLKRDAIANQKLVLHRRCKLIKSPFATRSSLRRHPLGRPNFVAF